jgi:hypothetical protein
MTIMKAFISLPCSETPKSTNIWHFVRYLVNDITSYKHTQSKGRTLPYKHRVKKNTSKSSYKHKSMEEYFL